ncbi:MAG TPA: class I SAM-dependent methyltransferase [Opitutaceae bacterium]
MAARSNIGEDRVRAWARGLPRHATVLDLGCGHGVPLARALLEDGVVLYGIDASPSMIAAFRERFPNVSAECNAVEASDLFRRTFDGVMAWGLMFLLAPESQELVVRKVSQALGPRGRFLFTAPAQACEWQDALTGLKSVSLGAEAYSHLLSAAGLMVTAQEQDDGENHYYLATKNA